MDLWQATTARLLGGAEPAMVEPASNDRRFKDPDWQENLAFGYIKKSYLMTARWMQKTVHDVEGLDDKTAKNSGTCWGYHRHWGNPLPFLDLYRQATEPGGEVDLFLSAPP